MGRSTAIHYLDSDEIRFASYVFNEIEATRMQFTKVGWLSLDKDTRLCLDFLYGTGTLCHKKRFSNTDLLSGYELKDSYRYILTGNHLDGSAGTAPNDLRELASFVLQYGDYFDVIFQKIKKENRSFFDEIISKYEQNQSL